MTDTDILEQNPPVQPQTKLVWTAIVEVGEKLDLGVKAGNERFLVPITGGRFFGGPGYETLKGTVLPGGADRQVLRPDGVKQLEAIYEMQIENGPVISLENRVITHATQDGGRYAVSSISVDVEDGLFGWLNKRVFLGTLQSLRPERPIVIIRAWEVDVPY